uniref:Uncharacterized protein n=1 Tax=Coccolithus braarudii TaxID=221442 RepID=A0A7S0LSK1_9EUKA|mmetsp:Transcript_5147/g.11314  ORF Transcript_5147/g.11314 Transcript_5147/m.11314 type:complete len:192 (+) Transcript_5147:53-628(+)|eukprot:CAMPEP_0183349468 /NCGR_PEP_ID=MMETSP0164_2-20130417/13629_1 /TAXON_ID=221442 /ORGANISM="Coccolithus pelagicus ssp braarudi, Strain PLY182g" /LENGTH=191 /DNA_ID=CAMNT_0025521187 /DNA_START=32 /DNA_END=607 /DNA_ORIENTATION=-
MAALALFGTCSSAFVQQPILRASAPTLASSSIEAKLVGESGPFPGIFDPLGFSTKADAKKMAWYREAELKHGRVAMLASLGMITAEKWHPLFGGKNSPNPLDAIAGVPKLGWMQVILFIGFMEAISTLNMERDDYEPGNFLGSAQWETTEVWDDYQLRELNNGRLAMFASLGMIVGCAITGKGPLETAFGA